MGMTALLCALGGYLAGSIPFALIASRVFALPDPRTYGSRNVGATNVLRSGSRAAALLTLIGDVGKGWVAVLAARLLGMPIELVALTGVAAFVGHVFPMWLRFHGGKGVATAAGVLIAFDWRIGLGVVLVWLAIAVATRYSSLGSLLAALAAPAITWWLQGRGALLAAVGVMSAIVVLRHRANIVKLVRGQESRIGENRGKAEEAVS